MIQDTAVIHYDTVIHEFFQILYDMRGQEYRLASAACIVAQVFDKQTPVSWIEAEREVIQHQQVGILRKYQTESHLRTLSVAMVEIFCLGATCNLDIRS